MTKKKVIYEIAISILAVFAVVLAIIDIVNGLNAWQSYADTIILLIFVIDYVVRFVIAKDKKQFFKSNILDLVAIIPFSSAFRILRAFKLTKLVKLAKLSKLTKLGRVATTSSRMIVKSKRFLDTNGFKYMLALVVACIFLGAAGISYFDGMSFPDGLWWAFVTTTTVGYGDLSPASVPGRIIAVILMIVGIGLLGSLTSTITSFFLHSTPKSAKDETIQNVKSMLDRYDTLTNQDIDDICSILHTLHEKQINE